MQIKALSLLALTPLAAAVGNAVVKNSCDHPVYLWSVGGSVGPKQTIEAGGSYSEPFRHDDASGGISLKITTVDNGLYNGSPQLNYAYTLDNAGVWYDMSDVFGDPFSGSALVVKPSDASCPSICWPQGVSPGGSQVKVCQSGSDEVLELCAAKC
ncbi:blastomyces yeast-phase-specific protein [Aspergillus bertholletiae]|uniref:Blastomyces yeast-phase-specific protein n=1 Tax=Aspergillus bertholletiae TaxID=1226010 RepID=A0A5N7BQ86_9EURO|nr:blastomyces yeast-phase-specific protein [Aspergillus bertholletiae]